MLGESQAATEIRELWNEYEAGSTEEAKIVKVRSELLVIEGALLGIDEPISCVF